MGQQQPEICVVKASSQELRAARWRGKGTGRPILFFNGIGANLEILQPMAELLMEHSDVITFDMPGVGKSPDPRMPYRPRQAAKWAKAVLDHFGTHEVDVLGVSWGGGMAQQFARSYPDCARTLVLLATTPGITMVPGNLSAISRMLKPKRYSDPSYMMRNYETLYGDKVDDSARAHRERVTPPSKMGYAAQLVAMLGWTSLHFLPFLKQPTLIMSGDKDNIVPLINSRILKKVIPNADLKVVLGGGHLFMVSRTAEVVPIIRRFLNDHADEPESNGMGRAA